MRFGLFSLFLFALCGSNFAQDQHPRLERLKERRAERIEAREQRQANTHAQTPASDMPSAGQVDTRHLAAGGQRRSYDFVTASKKIAPVLFFFHGGYGSAAQFRRSVAFETVATQAGWHLVFVQAKDRHWNDGRGTAAQGVDDVAYFNAILDKLIASGDADPKRIAVVGISNGGMLAQRLAAEDDKGRIAAAVSVAASMPSPLKSTPTKGHHVLLIQGDQDTTVPISGGQVKSPDGGEVLGMQATLAIWRALSAQHKVEGHVVTGGGHNWPSSKPTEWQATPFITQWLSTIFQ